MEGFSMKTYYKELADLKKENFSLKLRIYELEKHLQQTSQDSFEDVVETVVERELQDRLREKEMELVQIQDQHLAKVLEVRRLQFALQNKEEHLTGLQQINEQLQEELEDLRHQWRKDSEAVKEFTVQMEMQQEHTKDVENMAEVLFRRLQTRQHEGQKQKDAEEQLITTLFEKLEATEKELRDERKNGVKFAKAIQGLLQVVEEKEKEIAKRHHGTVDRDAALGKNQASARSQPHLMSVKPPSFF